MAEANYICERPLATAIYLAQKLGKPLLLEGHAGVGKTEVAKIITEILQTKLIRLQCYDGLDASHALYEWNYPRQIMAINVAELGGHTQHDDRDDLIEKDIFNEKFLLTRPLLEAITSDSKIPVVLLIDEIDRADEEFEAFLLEVLSDFQITIPELGTIKAKVSPYVIVTSNGTRELNDALKRRCIYHWIESPSSEKELSIVLRKIPDLPANLARQICAFHKRIKSMDLLSFPGMVETLNWALNLLRMSRDTIDEETFEEAMGCLLKYQESMDNYKSMLKATQTTCGMHDELNNGEDSDSGNSGC